MGILLGFVDASHDENRIAEALARAEAAERELAAIKAVLTEVLEFIEEHELCEGYYGGSDEEGGTKYNLAPVDNESITAKIRQAIAKDGER